MTDKIRHSNQIGEAAQRRHAVKRVHQASVAPTRSVDPVLLQRAIADPAHSAPTDVLALQCLVGNRAVQRLIQAKLTVGPAGDRYEQEADRVAQQVMTRPAPAQTQPTVQRAEEEDELQMKPLAASITPLVQRAPEEEEELQMKPLAEQVQRVEEDEEELQAKPLVQCAPEEEEELQMKPLTERVQRVEEEEDEEELQAKPLVQRAEEDEEEEELQAKPEVQRASSGAGFEVGGEFEQQLAASRGGGSPLPVEVRSFMEPRFGADFSGVRIHAGSEAVQLNREVSAQAFTLGQDIFMGEGKYNPNSAGGNQLLAHELTHVVQQGGSGDLHRRPEGSDERRYTSIAVGLPIQVHAVSSGGIARAPTPYDPTTRTTEQLWADCDPTVVDQGEKDVPGRVAAATAALKAVPGYQADIVVALLSNDYGKTPRAFIGAATEDAFGLGGHIVTKHVEAGTEDDGRTTQASRVITHKDAYGGSCPGKAGAFAGVAAADTALKIAINALFAQNGGWTAAGGWRDKVAKGVGFQGDMAVTATGYVQQRPDGEKKKYPAKEQPPFLSPSDGEGGRPLYPGDPNFLTNMEPYKQTKAKPEDPDVYMSAGKAKTKKQAAVPGNVITLDLSNPMTVNVTPSQITIRVVATTNTSAAGWYINSAWPV